MENINDNKNVDNKATNKKETAKDKLADIVAEDNKPANVDIKDISGVKIPEDTLIDVKSNCFGTLLYKGRDGTTNWSKCGEVQQLSIKELREIKAKSPKFYENQWVVLLGVSSDSNCKAKPADVYKSLGVTKWYQSIVEPSNFNDICSWEPHTIASKIKLMSSGARENLIIALNTYISKGVLDSRKKIKAFEQVLGVALAKQED